MKYFWIDHHITIHELNKIFLDFYNKIFLHYLSPPGSFGACWTRWGWPRRSPGPRPCCWSAGCSCLGWPPCSAQPRTRQPRSGLQHNSGDIRVVMKCLASEYTTHYYGITHYIIMCITVYYTHDMWPCFSCIRSEPLLQIVTPAVLKEVRIKIKRQCVWACDVCVFSPRETPLFLLSRSSWPSSVVRMVCN